jgi:hypothetical protein
MLRSKRRIHSDIVALSAANADRRGGGVFGFLKEVPCTS